MKKTCLIIISTLFVFISCVTTNSVPDNEPLFTVVDSTTIQCIFDVKTQRQEAYKNVNTWIGSSFTGNNVNILNRVENESIKGNGNLIINVEVNFIPNTREIFFEYIIEVKDNKIRFTIKNMYFYLSVVNTDGIPTGATQKYYLTKRDIKLTIPAIAEKKFISNMQNAINGSEVKDTW